MPDKPQPFVYRPDPDLPLSLQYVDVLIASQGNIRLAAERAKVQPGIFIATISSDEDARAIMTERMRTTLQIHAFQMIHESQIVFSAALPELEPQDAIKAYTSLLTAFADLTRDAQSGPTKSDIYATVRQMARERGLSEDDALAAVKQAERLMRDTSNGANGQH